MERNKQVIRILKVIRYLELNPHGLTVEEIRKKLQADKIQIAARTIYRDFEAIESLHLPLENENEEKTGRWKLNSTTKIGEKINISYQELFALFIARSSLKTLQGSPIFDALETFFDKLEKTLGPQAHQAFEEFMSFVSFQPSSTWQSKVSQEILDTLHSGCAEGQVLEVEYQSVAGANAGQIKKRMLGPEFLLFNEAGAYLMAKDLASGDIKSYALARIKNAILTEQAYVATKQDAKEILKNNFGVFSSGEIDKVEIMIEEPLASYVAERRWHESQQVIRVSNGIKLKLEVRINDELARWVLSLGPACKVTSPDSLRDRLAELAAQIGKHYPSHKKAS